MSQPLSDRDRATYLKKIERLEADNRLLRMIIVEERRLRQEAWLEHWRWVKRFQGRFFGMIAGIICAMNAPDLSGASIPESPIRRLREAG